MSPVLPRSSAATLGDTAKAPGPSGPGAARKGSGGLYFVRSSSIFSSSSEGSRPGVWRLNFVIAKRKIT